MYSPLAEKNVYNEEIMTKTCQEDVHLNFGKKSWQTIIHIKHNAILFLTK